MMYSEVTEPYKNSLLIVNKTPDDKKQFVEWNEVKEAIEKERCGNNNKEDNNNCSYIDNKSRDISEIIVNNDQIIFDITKYLEYQYEFMSKCNMPKLFDIIKNNITVEPEDNEDEEDDEDLDLFEDFT